jgi:hypothetical protein
MTPDDRELVLSLRRQQASLAEALEKIGARLGELEGRLEHTAEPPPLPAIPASHDAELPPLPPEPTETAQPTMETSVELPPVPAHTKETTPAPPPVILPPVPRASLEFQFGRWLIRIGAVLAVLTLILGDFYLFHRHWLGPVGIFASGGALSFIIIALGERSERKRPGMIYFGRTITALGLALLYVTFYAGATVAALQVVHNPVLGGLLLLSWSVYVLVLAERKQSQTLSLFAIALAYFSSAINPVGTLTMGADLLLAATALLFLLRNGWAALSYLCLAGTYLAPLRRLLTDENGGLSFEHSRTIHFLPYAVYLAGAWLIFTACVLLSTAPTFRGAKRFAFLTLNNGAFALLLLFTGYLAGYGAGAFGKILLGVGALLVALAAVSRWTRAGTAVQSAYLAQGLVLLTAGVVVEYTGISRGVLLALETLFLGWAGSRSREIVLSACALLAGFGATVFIGWQIEVNAHHPWLLGIGGAAILLANAFWTRRGLVREPARRGAELTEVRLSSACHTVFALILLYAAMAAELSDAILPPALAWVAVALTFTIYLVRIPALPPLAQFYLIGAQGLVLFPVETGEGHAWWSPALVALATVVVILGWSRRGASGWLLLLNGVYSLALVGLAYQAVRPYVDLPQWMMSAALLSFVFLACGALARVWTLAALGQLFLVLALYHFFLPDGWSGTGTFKLEPFPWSAWIAAVPIAVVFATGRATLNWLRAFPEIAPEARLILPPVARGYLLLALVMVVRIVFAKIPAPEQIAVLFFAASLLVFWNAWRPSLFGVRCGWGLGLFAMLLYFWRGTAALPPTLVDAVAVLCLLTLPALATYGRKAVGRAWESWIMVLAAAVTGWIFVSHAVTVKIEPAAVTMGWALYALLLFVLGLALWERRLRWCGLVILLAALVRAFVMLVLAFQTNASEGSSVLTALVLTGITLGLGYVYARFGEKLKTWL